MRARERKKGGERERERDKGHAKIFTDNLFIDIFSITFNSRLFM